MSNIVLSNTEYKVVGTRPIRHDGTDKVTGRAKYGADFDMSGLLQGKVLRSPHAHARIKSIDTSKAEAYPGVKAVITVKDLPISAMEDPNQSMRFASDNVLAREKALYKGHAVAAVVADNPHIAEAALALIEVDYEVLPATINVLDAMKDNAPLVHEDMTTKELGEATDKPSNIVDHFRYELGDLEKGFAEADVVVEREFTTQTVHQGYIEPQNASAFWNADGQLTVWTSTQGAFSAREALAQVLDLPVSKIKVVPMEIGGGFGGKIPIYLEPLAALLSKKTGQPVKMQMTRTEVFDSTGPTSAAWVKVKVGANRDGKITAAEASLAMEAGAFPGSPVTMGTQCLFAPYEIENGVVDGYDVLVNKAKVAPYRAPGAPIAAFGGEQVIDEIAGKLGIDPIEFRLRNASKEGTRRIDGPVFPRRRQRGDRGGGPGHRALQQSPGRTLPGSRRSVGLLVQHRVAVQLQHQRQRRWHHHPGGRLHRHRRHPGLHCHAGRRGPGHLRRGCASQRRRHRFRGVHLPHRRQPHHLRQRLGGLRGGPGHQEQDD